MVALVSLKREEGVIGTFCVEGDRTIPAVNSTRRKTIQHGIMVLMPKKQYKYSSRSSLISPFLTYSTPTMNTRSLVLLLICVLTLLASANASKGRRLRKRPNRMPTELRKFNVTFLRGTFAFGPSTNAELLCRNNFFNSIPPSTVQVAIASINNASVKTTPSADAIATFQQVNGTGLFRNGEDEIRIIARGPVFRGRYVYIVSFDGASISAEISNVRLFNRIFRRRVIRFIRRFRMGRVRNLLRNRTCRRMLTRKFMFPATAPAPMEPTPAPQDPAQDPPQDPEPDVQPDPAPEMTPMAEQDPVPEEDPETTSEMTM